MKHFKCIWFTVALACHFGIVCALGQETTPGLVPVSPHKACVEAARSQIGITRSYDPAYAVMSYPGGDVPEDRGVCTDVIIRALRKGCQFDLQKEVHTDMASHFSKYPRKWSLSKPDKNIDHRRVPNLQTFFARKGWSIEVKKMAAYAADPSAFQPGDFITVTVPVNLPHIMMVSDKKTPEGRPLVLHNIGRGTAEEDCLLTYPITGHYRQKFPAKPTK